MQIRWDATVFFLGDTFFGAATTPTYPKNYVSNNSSESNYLFAWNKMTAQKSKKILEFLISESMIAASNIHSNSNILTAIERGYTILYLWMYLLTYWRCKKTKIEENVGN